MELRAIAKLSERRPEGLLYHYTTMAGVLGIVSTKTIWATHIKYLNDSMEFELAKNIGVEVAESLQKASTSDPDRRIWRDVIRGINKAGINICVASFSEQGDLLSQWRGYASPGGCSLGFDHAFLASAAAVDSWRFLPCVYDPDEQREVMREILLEVFETNMRLISDGSYDDFNGGDAAARMNQLAGIFKDRSFKEEKEWRLLSRPLSCAQEAFKLRPGASMLVPYFEKDLKDAQGVMQLQQVIAAPTPHPKLSCSSLETLLIKHGYREEARSRVQVACPVLDDTVSKLVTAANPLLIRMTLSGHEGVFAGRVARTFRRLRHPANGHSIAQCPRRVGGRRGRATKAAAPKIATPSAAQSSLRAPLQTSA